MLATWPFCCALFMLNWVLHLYYYPISLLLDMTRGKDSLHQASRWWYISGEDSVLLATYSNFLRWNYFLSTRGPAPSPLTNGNIGVHTYRVCVCVKWNYLHLVKMKNCHKTGFFNDIQAAQVSPWAPSPGNGRPAHQKQRNSEITIRMPLEPYKIWPYSDITKFVWTI